MAFDFSKPKQYENLHPGFVNFSIGLYGIRCSSYSISGDVYWNELSPLVSRVVFPSSREALSSRYFLAWLQSAESLPPSNSSQ
jgi:hypothetical protein